jgi:hypothetical protein
MDQFEANGTKQKPEKIKKHRKNKKSNILRLFGENPNVKKNNLEKT